MRRFARGKWKLKFAREACCLSQSQCGGRFRIGRDGWNLVGFAGLREKFHNRGRRSDKRSA